MTLSEFKAFLEGMDIQDAPTPEQWERIQKKIQLLGTNPIQPGARFPEWIDVSKLRPPYDVTCSAKSDTRVDKPVYGPPQPGIDRTKAGWNTNESNQTPSLRKA